MVSSRMVVLVAAAFLVPSQAAASYSAADSALAKTIRIIEGPAQYAVKREVLIWVPDGIHLIFDTEKTAQVTDLYIPYDDVFAMAVPAGGDAWYAFLRYIDGGHVPDSSVLDPDSILAAIKIRDNDRDEERVELGWSQTMIDGWQRVPSYDRGTHTLRWTVHVTGQKGAFALHSARVLGRRGHVHVEMHCRADDLEAFLPEFEQLMRGVLFTENHRYRDYRAGDRLASYTLNGIVAGEDAWNAAKQKRSDDRLRLITSLIWTLGVGYGGKYVIKQWRARKAASGPGADEARV
jgi:uncharacterized membrane-anchored protein